MPYSSALIFVLVLGCSFVTSYRSYKNYKLLRVDVDPTDYRWLERLAERYPKHFDIWSEPNKLSPHADVLISPRFYQRFLNKLDRMDLKEGRILVYDMQKEIDREMKDVQFKRNKRSFVSNKGEMFDIEKYHTYAEMIHFMHSLSQRFHQFVSIANVSQSFEKRDIIGLKIGKKSPWKPAIFIDAGIHAREWIAPATAIYFMNKLITEYGTNNQVTRLVDKFDWFIVPLANPDGYEFSITNDRYWRKTRSRNETVSRTCAGVDANRNWGFRWGEAGANRYPCSPIYAGSRPFSEPEVAGMKDFIANNIPDLKLYISLHSYGQIWLSPWGYANTPTANHADQEEAAKRAVDAIKRQSGLTYNYGTIAEVMYPASGTSIDYMQDVGIPYIFGVELRPEEDYTDRPNYGFSIHADQIKPTGEEMFTAFLEIAEYIIETKNL